MSKKYFIYIISNRYHTVFYTGVTNGIVRRIYEHKQKLVDGFTKKYNINKLLYYEEYSEPYLAISREKQIKDLRRSGKLKLIKKLNPTMKDLYNDIV